MPETKKTPYAVGMVRNDQSFAVGLIRDGESSVPLETIGPADFASCEKLTPPDANTTIYKDDRG